MSFTKYVEVVENSATMNMLPAKVTVLSIGKQCDMKNFEGSSFILILPAHSDALRSVCVACS